MRFPLRGNGVSRCRYSATADDVYESQALLAAAVNITLVLHSRRESPKV